MQKQRTSHKFSQSTEVCVARESTNAGRMSATTTVPQTTERKGMAINLPEDAHQEFEHDLTR